VIVQKRKTFSDHDLNLQIDDIVYAINNYFKNLPVYDDNTAALAGGLVADDPYITTTGVVMVVN
jgi:hypothetical protein